MEKPTALRPSRDAGRLIKPTPEEQQAAIGQWRYTTSGTERITQLDKPDDPVAYKLLDAAGDAIGRGQVQAGLNILQLIARDYRHSQEAALARQAIDQMKKQAGRGR